MKHDNIVMYETFSWDWNKIAICDDAIFIILCIDETIGDEIWWPFIKEQATFGIHIPKF
jgi:hypothetical protein